MSARDFARLALGNRLSWADAGVIALAAILIYSGHFWYGILWFGLGSAVAYAAEEMWG